MAYNRHESRLALFVITLLACSCAPRPRFLSGDPETTFVGHETSGIIVIDRVPRGQPTVIRPKASWGRRSEIYVPAEGAAANWTLTLRGPGEVIVSHANDAARYARVTPNWDDSAIRLTLERREGPSLRTDVLTRAVGADHSSFSRNQQVSIELRGPYEGAVRDPDGRQVGWLRLSVSTRQAHVLCEGVLPPDIDEPMAAATLLALVSEVDWIENHARGVSREPVERP